MIWEAKGDKATLARVKAMATFHHAKLTSINGHGQMLGSWDSREEGRKAYERVIATWGKSNPQAYNRWKSDVLSKWAFGANKSIKDRL
jgi:hypothetical protein